MRCELLSDSQLRALTDSLGPDPLRADADPEQAWESLSQYRGPIGAALLDQSVIAGIGNVFRAEALAACHVHPGRLAADVVRRDFDCLWKTLSVMMARGVDEGRIITVEAPAGSDVPEAEARYVYKQAVVPAMR